MVLVVIQRRANKRGGGLRCRAVLLFQGSAVMLFTGADAQRHRVPSGNGRAYRDTGAQRGFAVWRPSFGALPHGAKNRGQCGVAGLRQNVTGYLAPNRFQTASQFRHAGNVYGDHAATSEWVMR